MSFLDWSIVAIPLIAIVVIGVVAQHYTNNVAGFLAAGRKAGRYLLTVADGAEARDMDLNGLRERVENIGDDAMLSLRYDPSTGAIELSAIHDGRGMRLSGVMTLTFEPMTFIDVTAEEEKYDLMNLSPQTLEQLQDELGMIFTKFTDYAGKQMGYHQVWLKPPRGR